MKEANTGENTPHQNKPLNQLPRRDFLAGGATAIAAGSILATRGQPPSTGEQAISIDALVVGGGVQGLMLLNRLTEQGYSTILVTNADLGAGQTLHSHGIPNSGYPYFPS